MKNTLKVTTPTDREIVMTRVFDCAAPAGLGCDGQAGAAQALAERPARLGMVAVRGRSPRGRHSAGRGAGPTAPKWRWPASIAKSSPPERIVRTESFDLRLRTSVRRTARDPRPRRERRQDAADAHRALSIEGSTRRHRGAPPSLRGRRGDRRLEKGDRAARVGLRDREGGGIAPAPTLDVATFLNASGRTLPIDHIRATSRRRGRGVGGLPGELAAAAQAAGFEVRSTDGTRTRLSAAPPPRTVPRRHPPHRAFQAAALEYPRPLYLLQRLQEAPVRHPCRSGRPPVPATAGQVQLSPSSSKLAVSDASTRRFLKTRGSRLGPMRCASRCLSEAQAPGCRPPDWASSRCRGGGCPTWVARSAHAAEMLTNCSTTRGGPWRAASGFHRGARRDRDPRCWPARPGPVGARLEVGSFERLEAASIATGSR